MLRLSLAKSCIDSTLAREQVDLFLLGTRFSISLSTWSIQFFREEYTYICIHLNINKEFQRVVRRQIKYHAKNFSKFTNLLKKGY